MPRPLARGAARAACPSSAGQGSNLYPRIFRCSPTQTCARAPTIERDVSTLCHLSYRPLFRLETALASLDGPPLVVRYANDPSRIRTCVPGLECTPAVRSPRGDKKRAREATGVLDCYTTGSTTRPTSTPRERFSKQGCTPAVIRWLVVAPRPSRVLSRGPRRTRTGQAPGRVRVFGRPALPLPIGRGASARQSGLAMALRHTAPPSRR